MPPAFFFLLAMALAQEPETAYERAYREYLNHDLDSAKRDFLLLVKGAPPALHSRYFLGRIALASRKFEEAIQWLKPVASVEPPILDAREQLGKAYVGSGQLDKARDVTLEALRVTPWDGSLHYRLGRIYQEMGQPAKTKEEFAASARLKSADQQAVIQLSECVRDIAGGHKNDAMEIRRQFMENAQLDPDALVALGKIFADAGLQGEALDLFLIASQRDPLSFEAHYDLGLTLLNLGKYREAAAPLEAALDFQPQSQDTSSALALAYVMAGRYAECVALLERMPENPRLASLLGLAYLRSGAPGKAVRVLRKELAVSADPKTLFLLIEALNGTEDQAAALAVAEDAARRFPDLTQAHLARAQQLARMGRYTAAAPIFEKVVNMDPKQADATLGWAEALQKAGEYEQSLSVYERALQQEGANVAAQLGVARNLISLRRFAEARERLESAVAAQPQNPQLRLELSRAYARLGQPDRATDQTRILQELKRQQAPPQ